MGFNLKSGNTTPFKKMGSSSPMTQDPSGKTEYMFKVPAGETHKGGKTTTLASGEVIDWDPEKRQVVDVSDDPKTKGTKKAAKRTKVGSKLTTGSKLWNVIRTFIKTGGKRIPVVAGGYLLHEVFGSPTAEVFKKIQVMKDKGLSEEEIVNKLKNRLDISKKQ